MISPPGLARTSASPAGNWHGGPTRDDLLVAAHTVLINCGIEMRPARVRRLVQTFEQRVERNGFGFFDFLANAVQLTVQQRRAALANPDVARVVAYADPTGEAAVNNVLRDRGR